MQDDSSPEAPLTLATLRRRGRPRPPAAAQPNLFAAFPDLPPDSPATQREDPAQPQSPAQPHSPAQPQSPAQRRADPVPAPPNPGPAARTSSLTAPPRSERPERDSGPKTTPEPEPEPTPEPEPEPAPEAPPRTWTVSTLVRHVRGLVEQGYGKVTVEGEISNWRPAASGHCYFTLKDAGAQLSAVLFRRQAALLRFRPADGDAVRIHGQLSIYESRGQMQLIAEWVEQVGLGALLAAVQRLKEKLRREGLFDRKRPLPPFPRCIGVVTSLHGAALRDIVKVCRRRHAAVQLLIYPAAVQGPNCPAEIAAGLRWFNTHPDRAEVILVARGGGSWEDLHGFDDEAVVRAIAASALPVITGIGHAPDSTLADAAADLCAPTPSAAAELLTAAHHRIEERVASLHTRLLRSTRFELLRSQQRLARLGAANVLRRVEDSLNRRAQRTDELTFRAEAATRDRLRRAESRLRALQLRLAQHDPTVRLALTHRRLEALQTRLAQASRQRLQTSTRRLDRGLARLEAMSPLRVLDRGYALVYGPDNHLLRFPADAPPGTPITARLAHGTLKARTLP